MKVLITGANGFFARILVPELVKLNYECVITDFNFDDDSFPVLQKITCDLSNVESINLLSSNGPYDVIFHLASKIDFAVKKQSDLYNNNVRCSENISEIAIQTLCKKIIFTSSNSIYLGNNASDALTESLIPKPLDPYGFSKIRSEEIFSNNSDKYDAVIIRCPNIIDSGRLGMLSILFEFISEGRKCWMIGTGDVRHQCIYADDLSNACILAIKYNGSNIFNIGSDNVPTIREMYEYLIEKSNSKSKIISLPIAPTLLLLKLLKLLKLSPLGVYQFRMLTDNFIFNTSHIKSELNWNPSLSNQEMLLKAYTYFDKNQAAIRSNTEVSANRGSISLGILKLLKLIS